jgi:hypothetical protein
MALCSKCGHEVQEKQLICNNCGYMKRYVKSDTKAGLYLNSVIMTYKQSGLLSTISFLISAFIRAILFPCTIKEMIVARFRRKNLFDFNAVGVDGHLQKNDTFLKEAEEIKLTIRSFIENTNREIDKVYSETDEDKIKQLKPIIAKQAIDKIKWLHEVGGGKLYKADYKILKRELILTLARLFETYLDQELLEYSTSILEKDGILPTKSNIEIMKLTPMGRWL